MKNISNIFNSGIDMREFGCFVFYGFVFISIIQLIGHFNYDEAPTSVSLKNIKDGHREKLAVLLY